MVTLVPVCGQMCSTSVTSRVVLLVAGIPDPDGAGVGIGV
jgi:hypothetical protein